MMKKYMAFLGVLILVLSSCNSEFNDAPTTNTPVNRTITPTVIPIITNTLQASTAQENKDFAAEFPLPILSKQQIQEVADCKIQELADKRYPENITLADLPKGFIPKSDCDWAVLSYAYAVRSENDVLSQPGLEAFRKAASNNYGYALTSHIFDYYFGSVPLVKNPPVANQELEKVEINYTWSGLGEPSTVKHSVVIVNANIDPIVSSSTDQINSNISLDKSTVQDLTQALNDLLPIDSEIQLIYCTDNFPEWSVKLTFTDDTKIEMWSDSNYLFVGGPWQTQIDGQTYIQYSQTFAHTMSKLMEELGLPLGNPAAMYCPGGGVFENAFNRFLPPTSTPSPNFAAEAIFTAAAQTVEAQMTQMTPETPTPKP